MLKAGIIICAICAGAGGTAMSLKLDRAVQSGGTVRGVSSFLEQHNNAHLEHLPAREIKDLPGP